LLDLVVLERVRLNLSVMWDQWKWRWFGGYFYNLVDDTLISHNGVVDIVEVVCLFYLKCF
jgi:hypothetical protein